MAEIAFYHDQEAKIQPDQYAAEFSALLDIYRELRPMRVLEIGTRRGGTFYQWVKHAPEGATVCGIDLPIGPWDDHREAQDYRGVWHAATDRRVCVWAIIGDSHYPLTLAAIKATMPEIDFLFIDGDHSEIGVRRDLADYAPLIRPGGVIALHDILPDESDGFIQIHKVWREIKEEYPISKEITSAAKQDGRGIGVLYA